MSKKPNMVVERSRNDFVDQVNITSTSLRDQLFGHTLRLGNSQKIF